MSSGHVDDVPEPSDELRALLTTEVMCAIAALVAEAQVVDGYQVPYVFGVSSDATKVYRSTGVPGVLSDGEHEFASDAGCAWHECGEWYLMERVGLTYDDAHSLVTWCVERPVVEGIMRLDWAGYQAAFVPYIVTDEVEELLVCPPDLYMGPYLADARPALVAAIRAAQARAEAWAKVAKGNNEDEPRDEHGRWTSGGSKLGSFKISKREIDLGNKLGLFNSRESANLLTDQLMKGLPPGERPNVKWSASEKGLSLTVQMSGDSTLQRTFSSVGGSTVVSHDEFSLDTKYRGGGHAEEVMKSSLSTYDRLGIGRISMTANMESGGYVWAKLGFQPDDVSGFRNDMEERLNGLHDVGVPTSDVGHAQSVLRSADDRSVARDLSQTTAGKLALLGSSWEAHVNMNDIDHRKWLDAILAG